MKWNLKLRKRFANVELHQVLVWLAVLLTLTMLAFIGWDSWQVRRIEKMRGEIADKLAGDPLKEDDSPSERTNEFIDGGRCHPRQPHEGGACLQNTEGAWCIDGFYPIVQRGYPLWVTCEKQNPR